MNVYLSVKLTVILLSMLPFSNLISLTVIISSYTVYNTCMLHTEKQSIYYTFIPSELKNVTNAEPGGTRMQSLTAPSSPFDSELSKYS